MEGSNVDEWTEDVLYQWLEDNEIDASLVESITELRMLVRSRQEQPQSVTTVNEDTHRVQRLVTAIIEKERKKRHDLRQLYMEIKQFHRDFGAKVGLELPVIDQLIKDLDDQECTIVVAGEVSSGKSSLLNLLIGENIFPTAHLACTSTICRLHNSTRKAIEIKSRGLVVEPFANIADLHQWLKEYAVKRDGDELSGQLTDIFWPVPLLPDNVLLVDVPGIGESHDMNRMVLDYLSKSLVCVYVLFSANAGGVQEDKLGIMLEEQNRIRNLEFFDNTLFVCNKWDIVTDSGQEDEVWKDTIRKLKGLIPTLDVHKVVKMSVEEAFRYRTLGIGETGYCTTLIGKFQQLLQNALSAKTSYHSRLQRQLLNKTNSFFAMRGNLASLSHDEKRTKIEKTRSELASLEEKSKEKTRELRDLIEKDVKEISGLLHEYLHEEGTRERLLDCKNEEEPSRNLSNANSKVQLFLIKQRVLFKLRKVIAEWETENQKLAGLHDKVMDELKEFITFTSDRLRSIDLDLADCSEEKLSVLALEHDTFEPDHVLYSTQGKVIMAVSSPVWLPLGLAVTVVGVPIYLAYHGIRELIVCRKYSNNEFQHRMYHRMEFLLKERLSKNNVETYLVKAHSNGLLEQVDSIINERVQMETRERERELLCCTIVCENADATLEVIKQSKPHLDNLFGRLKEYLQQASGDHTGEER